jgi:hypothetical protein
MGRILVIHPHQGFLDMVARILTDRYEVQVLEHYRPAETRLATGAPYEAVLCGLSEPAWAIRIFEKAAAASEHTRLIPIASDLTQLDWFRDQWNSDAPRKQNYGSVGQEWLPEHVTVGDIHALFASHAQEQAPDAVGTQAVND